MTANEIKQYTEQLGLTCNHEDCLAILETATEWGINQTKAAVWAYLDAYEGICHSRDTEYWEN